MASAWVIEVRGDKSQHQCGRFEFTQIPTVGDRIVIKSSDGTRLGYGVLQVEHFPARIPVESPDQEPNTTIYVHWLKEFPVE